MLETEATRKALLHPGLLPALLPALEAAATHEAEAAARALRSGDRSAGAAGPEMATALLTCARAAVHTELAAATNDSSAGALDAHKLWLSVTRSLLLPPRLLLCGVIRLDRRR